MIRAHRACEEDVRSNMKSGEYWKVPRSLKPSIVSTGSNLDRPQSLFYSFLRNLTAKLDWLVFTPFKADCSNTQKAMTKMSGPP